LSQDIPPSDPAEQDEDETWDTVGAAAERSVSPPLATREAVPESAQQGTGVVNLQTSAEEGRQDPSPTATMEKPEEAQTENEVATEAGIVDIASILGAPTVTVVRSTL
jgi:hypothetical protein